MQPSRPPVTDRLVRFALIGCGRIAGHHCRSIAEVDGVELAAVCDLEFGKAEAYSSEFGVPAFTDYRKMFADVEDIDIAAVITYTKNSWSNKTGQVVQPAEIVAARK